MQPLPVLTEEQEKLVGPVQPDGKEDNPEVIERLDADFPSSVVNVTLKLVLEPTSTLMSLVVEGVATILLLLVVTGTGGAADDPPPPPPHAVRIATLPATLHDFRDFKVFRALRMFTIDRLNPFRFDE